MDENQAERIQGKIKQERKPPKLKKFYKKATMAGKTAPFGVKLDGKMLVTPLKSELDLPTRKLAREIVEEWNSQEKFVEPDKMFLTKYANTTIDRVDPRREQIIDEIVAYAASDLICYRAATPQDLADRQNASWDPVLEWAKEKHNLGFVCVAGVVYANQPDETLIATHNLLCKESSYALTAIHNLTTMLGSALLAMAVADGFLKPDQMWLAAHVDEDWNIEQWGSDDDAIARRKFRRSEFDGILKFHHLSQK